MGLWEQVSHCSCILNAIDLLNIQGQRRRAQHVTSYRNDTGTNLSTFSLGGILTGWLLTDSIIQCQMILVWISALKATTNIFSLHPGWSGLHQGKCSNKVKNIWKKMWPLKCDKKYLKFKKRQYICLILLVDSIIPSAFFLFVCDLHQCSKLFCLNIHVWVCTDYFFRSSPDPKEVLSSCFSFGAHLGNL